MDDVWVVICLLLFGSLLFCLCCYKVTNLLYMLYHIDDSDSLTANELTTATTATAVTTSGALAVAPVAFALESNGGNEVSFCNLTSLAKIC